jgi:phosphomannomutase
MRAGSPAVTRHQQGDSVAELIVSISGIRGIVGDGLGPREALRFGLAFGSHLGGGTVVLGRDSRPSGEMLVSAVRGGLLATGCPVLDTGILSTPGVGVTVVDRGASGGVVVTASHNPSAYNGIKLLTAEGMAIDRDTGAAIRERYETETFNETAADAVAGAEPVPDAAERHVDQVLAIVDADAVRRRAPAVVLDATNGAGGPEMQMLLEHLGCRASVIHGEPTGRFGRGAEPVAANLADLCAAVREAGADIGLALDPDADRLALVDETGRAVGEEYTLALSTRHRLAQEAGPVAANLSTSRLMDAVAGEAGVVLHRTPVGELNVSEAIRTHGCVIGGEGNGGVIDPRVGLIRNSLVGAALVLEMMADRGASLGELIAELPVYIMVKDKVPLAGRADAAIEAVHARFADAEADRRDGLHLSWEVGWVHVRPSNTEPVLRILAEAGDEASARRWVDAVKDAVEA